MIKSKVIYGCEARGDAASPYLTRWTLLETKIGSLYLHQFHRSDADEMHDHPWSFWSVVLWPGYTEVTFQFTPWEPERREMRRWPLLPAFRPACYAHRVQLFSHKCRVCFGLGYDFAAATDLPGIPLCPKCQGTGRRERSCWTLIWVRPEGREWGFFTKAGWQNWREYFAEKGC